MLENLGWLPLNLVSMDRTSSVPCLVAEPGLLDGVPLTLGIVRKKLTLKEGLHIILMTLSVSQNNKLLSL